ncbi:DUF4347 domain-containing protein, partial [Azospirillum brasilense]|nr:DUF4347 domain-containing protein [Azospirillum brasilense]
MLVMLHSTASRPVSAILGCEGAPEASRREVAFIDTALDDWRALEAGTPAGIEVFLIDSRADGMAAMARTLDGRRDIHAIHVLSHGFEGGLQLGSGRFDTTALAQRVEELASIASSLAPDGDILLYGCDVASGRGADFLTALAEATGANVAASRTPTGAADRGGDWDLDWVHGAVTTDALRFDSYCGVMAAPTIVSGVAYVGENTIVLTFDQALDAASQPTLSYFASDMLTPSSVEINGAATNLSAAVISGNTLTLTLPMETFTSGDVLTIKYEDPTGNQTSGVLQASLSGDDVATFQNNVTVYGARPTTDPTLTATGGTTTFNASPVDLFSSVTADTNDTGQVFTGLTLTVTGLVDGASEMLGFTIPGMMGGPVTIALTGAGTLTGPFVGSAVGGVTLNGSTATVTISGLQYSAADMQSFIDSIAYNNTAGTPSNGQRVVTLTSVTDDGASNNTASLTGIAATINVGAPPLTLPTLTATGGTPTFTQGSVSGVDLFSGVTADTNDTGQVFTGLTLTITNVSDAEALLGIGTNVIALSVMPPLTQVVGLPGVTYGVSMNGTTATVTLSGLNHTNAQLATLIDGLSYINYTGGTFNGSPMSGNVTAGSRVITVTSVTDDGGNNHTASLTGVSATVNVTAAPPTPVLQSAAVTGDSLVLTYDVALDSANPPAVGAFTVTVGGTSVAVSSVAVDGANKTVTLTLGQVVAYGDTVAVSYTDPTAGDDANAIQAGTGGRDAASFTGQSVTNNSPDPSTTPPSVTAIDAYVGENVIIVTFDQALDAQSPLLLSSFGAVDSYIPLDLGTDAILVGSTKVDLRSAVISGNKLILTTASPLAQGDYVRFTYTDPTAGNDTANVLQNLSGLDLPDTRFATMVTTTRAVNTPSLTATGNATTFTSSSSPADLFSSVTANANDLGQVFTGLTFTVTGVLDGGSEYLIFMVPGGTSSIMNLTNGASLMSGTFGVTGGATLNGSTLTVTISGLRLSADEMQSLLDGFYYNNNASTPSNGQRIITLASVTDSGVSNNVGALTGISAVINIGAPSSPVLQSAAVNGTSLVLTYDTALDAVNIPSAGSFTVLAGGSPVTVSGVAVDTATKTVTLTLAQPVAHGAAVSVSYADPTAGDDANAIQSFGGGLDAAGFTGRSATNTTPDPNGVPPTLALTAKDGGFQSGQGSGGTDLFDGVTASTVDSGQTFTGMVLTVHNVGGTGSTEFLSIGGTDIALSNASSGSVAGGAYTVTLANGVATVTLSGMALSNGGMDTLIDGIAYKNTGSSSVAVGNSETRSVVLRSITDSGASANTTVIDKVATVSIANTTSYSPFLTVVPTNPSITFTPGTPQQVSFTLTATQARTLVGSNVIFGINAPSGWSVGSATLSPTISGIVSSGDTFTLTFDVMSSGTDTTGAFPISIYSMSTGIDLTNSAISSSVMVTVANPPVVQSATVNGTTLVLTYDKDLDAANPPAAGAFEVKVGGTTVSVSNVAVDGVNKTVTLTLAQGVTDADTVTVAYTDPTTGNDASAVQATNGDDAASFTARPVTNNSPDTTPPSLVSASVNGTTLTLTYSEALDGAADAAGSAFTVMVNGVARTVTGANASGTTVTLTLGSAVERYQTVTVGYTPPGSGAKTQDVAGNAAAAVTGREVRNVTVGDANFILLGTNPFGLVDIGTTARPTLVDIDGDGDLDLVTGNSGSSVRFYRNDGTAAEPSFTFVGTNPFGIGNTTYGTPTFGDLDGDGDLDLLLGNGSGLTVVYRNNGTATAPSFTMVGTSAFGIGQVGGGYAKATLWDLDGDGDLDLLFGGNDGTLTVYRNVGTSASPSFTVVGTNPYGLEDVGFASTPTFVDIDNDGDLDVLVGNFDGNTVVFRNVGTNAAPSFTVVGTNPYGLGDVGTAALPVFADLNGDGDLDALIGNGDGNFVVYLQGPPPPAAPSALALTAGTNTGSTADTITGNTAPTITGSAVPLSEVVLYDGASAIGTVTADSLGQWTLTTGTLAEGLHTLTAKSTSAYYTGTSAASTALSVTIDTTGPTLASARLNGTTLTLTYSEALDGAQAPTGAFAVTVGGVARTVSAVSVSGRTVTLTLDAGATLYQSVTVDYTPPGSGAKTADAAGNAAGAVSGRTVTVVGDPTFTLEGTNPFGLGDVGDNATPIFVDIDGDGALDALVGNFASKIVFYRNVGTATAPTFTLAGTNPFGLNPVGSGGAQPTFADLDGDGRLDALVGTAGGNTYFYRNVGTATQPTFTLQGSNPFGLSRAGFGSSVELADIDGDGDLDALIGVDDGHTVFYRNVGTATAPTFTLEGSNPFGLGNVGVSATPKLLDIDGDGDLDALIGSGDGKTYFYRNVGTAAAPTFVLEGTNPFGLGDVGDNATPIFVDIDGDGDLDALIGNTDGDTVLFRNGPPRPAAPGGLALTAGSNSGSTTDTLTKVTTPTITGTAEASATVVLYDGATVVGTATADGAGLWTITSASLSDGAHSLTANANTANGASAASTALSVTIDTAAPTLTAAVLSGTTLTLTYSEVLDGAQAPTGAFTVLVGGVARTVTAVATSGKTVTLTLDAGTTSAYQTVTIDYTPPGSGAKTADAAGNAAGALTGQPVREVADPSFVLEGTNPFGLATTGPWSIPTFADIDGDGDLDALVGMGDGTIRFYRNDGTATAPSFTLAGTNPFGLGALDMNAAPTFVDIDGNGTLDALIGDFNGNTVVYRNVGTATAPSFTLVGTNPFGLSTVGSATTPSFVDIDGDGDLDALIGNYDGNTVFFRNIGTATAPSFALEATNPFGLTDVGSYAQPTFQDIDGDGDLDALVGNFAGDMLFFRNVGTATAPSFTLEGTNLFGLSNVTFKSVPSLVDIDGDGSLDVLAGGDTVGNNIILFRNLPLQPASLALTTASNSGSTTDTLTNVTATAITGQAKASTTVVLYDGAVALGTTTADANGLWTITAASLSEGAHSLTAVASNGTNASLPSSRLNVTIDTTAPTLTSAVLSGTRLTLTYSEALDGTQTPVGGAFTVTVGGVVRTVTAVATAGRTVTLTLDAGASSLYEGATVSYTPPGSGARTVDAAGNAAGALNGQPVRVGGDPKFTLEATNPFGLGTFVGQSAPVFADIDGDGDLDAVVGDWYANIVVYRNVGTAEAPSFTLVGTNPFGLNTVGGGMPAFAKPTLADIDGDGDLDLLAGNAGGGIVVYRNNGTATAPSFTLVGTNPFGLSNAGGFASPSLADIDGDGDLDALIGNADGNTLFYRNVGTAAAPTFALESTNPFGLGNVGSNATPIFVDIDGDGDLDALIGNDSGNTVLYRNIGTATAPTFTLDGTNPFNLGDVGSNAKPIFADVDGDGDLDALIGRDDGKTVLFRNTTPPPATPTAPTLTTASNSGSTTDTLTNVTAPTIVGTATASSTVVLYDGATAIGTVTADAATGLWTFTTASLSDGAHTLTVTSGNVHGTSSASTALTLSIDTTAPTAPAVTSAALSNNATPTLTGTAEAGSTVTVTVGGATYTTTATNGTWSIDLATATPATGSLSLNANGANPVSVTATDAAGNTSSAGTQTLTIDTTAPNAPAVTSAALTNSATPVVSGTAEADSTVTVTIGGATYTTTATNGSWSINLATAVPATGSLSLNANGSNPVSVTATDAAGNISTAATQSLVVDTTAPAAPTVTSSAFTNNTTPTIAGTAEAGSTVTVSVGGATYTTTATNGGTWDIDLATATPTTGTLSLLPNVPVPVVATATDPAGNPSSPGTQMLTIDTVAPNAPAVSSPALSNSTTPTITGTAEAGSTVTVSIGGATYTTTATNGTWSIDLATTTPTSGSLSLNANGTNAVSATATDAAGNTSTAGTQTLTIDTTAPTAPVVTSAALTNNATPTITGTAEAGSTVTVSVGGATYTTTATNGGTWTLNLATATPTAGSLTLDANGSNAISATATDAAGNVSTAGTQSLTIDTTAPNAPAVTTALTNSAAPTIDGTAEAGSTVTVSVGGATYTTTATNGTWSINLATATPATGTLSLNANGANPVSATATDAAGNTSTAGTQTLTIDTTAPNSPTVTSAVLSNSTTPILTGTAETGSTVTVSVGGATYTTTATNGTWSINLATDTPAAGSLSLNANGTNTVSATATDAAGNVSAPGTQSLTIDTTAPNAPTVTTALSNSTTPTLTGAAEAGSTVTVTVGGATYATTATNGGTWTLDLATATPTTGSLSLNANGANPVSATATDAAGNTSSAGTQSLTIDTTLPNAPTVTSAVLTNSITPTLTGTAEADSTVTVTIGGATYTTTATNGTWSINLATATPTSGSLSLNANGTNPVSATSTDAAGNVSTPGTQSLTIDTTLPDAPTVTTALTNSTTPTLTGTAEANSTVTVTVGGATYTTTATNGTWSINLATATPTTGVLNLNANGANPVSATATDAAGNISTAGTQSLTVDTTLPDAPTVTTALSNSTTPTLTGTAEANSTVTVTVGGATYTTTASGTGAWSLNLATAVPTAGTLSLNPNGGNAISATATDAAGNVSAPGTQSLAVDTTLPDAPIMTSAALSNSTTPTLTGTAEADSTVTVTIGGATYTTTATNGTWSINLATATPTTGSLNLNLNGGNAVSATATDAAGNVSTAGTQSLTIDTTAPTAPAVTSAALSNSTTPTLTGTAEAGSTVTVTVGGATYTTTATNGSWSVNLATATPTTGSLSLNANGANPVSATATDAAGNTSSAGTQSLVVDTTLPNAPAVTSATL